MVDSSSIYLFSHPFDFDSIHVVDLDDVDFAMIPHNDLATHDGFSFPCSHATPNDDELNDDTYWSYFDHQWEEGLHMLVE